MYPKPSKYSAFFILLICLVLPSDGIRAQTDGKIIEQKLAQAAELLTAGDLDGSEKILREIIKSTPRSSEAQTLLGIAADRRNDLDQAEKFFAAAARFAPGRAETRNNYGAILLRRNRPREAAKEFTASLAINPSQTSALVNLAQIRFAENDLPAARSLFERAKAIDADAEILRALVIISVRLGEKEKARRDFEEYRELSLSNRGVQADARTELGAVLLEAEMPAEAVRELEASVALDASNSAALVLLARGYLKQKNITAAGKLLESAISRGGADAKIYLALAEVYQAGGFMENAIPALRLAIEKDPQNDYYRARYGLLLIDSKAPAAAIVRVGEALKEFPASAKLQIVLGIAQQADGKPLEARRSYERALQIEPDNVTALAYLATSLIEEARYADAVKTYEKAIALDERNAVLHYLLADTLLKIPSSEPSTIEKHLALAVTIDERLAPAHLALGKLYARAENWQKAFLEFERATRFAPESAEGYYQLGRTLARLKRNEESKIAFEKYKSLNNTQTAQKETERQELVRRLANVRF